MALGMDHGDAVRGEPDRPPGRRCGTSTDRLEVCASIALEDAGFHYSVLSEFQDRLLTYEREPLLLERLLEHAKEEGWLKGGRRQRTDSNHVLANIQHLNRIELVGETLSHALNEIARREPEWLQANAPSEWWQRYVR